MKLLPNREYQSILVLSTLNKYLYYRIFSGGFVTEAFGLYGLTRISYFRNDGNTIPRKAIMKQSALFPLHLILLLAASMQMPLFASERITGIISPGINDYITQELSPAGGDTVVIYKDEEDTPPAKVSLLPERLSILESAFWGERGMMRTFNRFALTPENRKNELELRRTMLSIHQIGGFVTLGAMLTTCYFGQKIIDGRRDLGDTKETLAGLTVLSYAVTAAFSLLSPPPMLRRDEASTITTHKLLAWVHIAGMVLTPILADGIASEGKRGAPGTGTIDLKKAHFHQVAGYLTTAVFAAALLTVTF